MNLWKEITYSRWSNNHTRQEQWSKTNPTSEEKYHITNKRGSHIFYQLTTYDQELINNIEVVRY